MMPRPWAMALLAATLLACRPPTSEQPNFVVIITDDQRWDGLGVVQQEQGEEGRFQWLETPHLDRLAAEGVRFRNAFVVTSLCSPARASFLTGRYAHAHGVTDNKTPFPHDATTFAGLLRRAGYRTGYVGKWHMGDQSGPRPGFDVSASFVGQGRYFDQPFEIDGVRVATEGFVDDVATDKAIDFLRHEGDEPFLLVVGFKAPHGPRVPPHRLRSKYEGRKAEPARNANHLPPFFEEPAFTPPAGVAALRRLASRQSPENEAKSADSKDARRKSRSRKAADRRNAHREGPHQKGARLLDYLRLISALDENVGRLVGALDELGLSDRTVIIFASDNGYYFGEHSLAGKCSAYEESMRIPLLVHHPGLGEAARGRIVDKIALNIDLAPTLLDLAGVAVPATMQGRSWLPLLDGTATQWRDSFLYVYTHTPDFAFQSPTIVALRSEDAKLIQYPGYDAWTELFDLVADPYELDNLASKRPALLAEMQRELEIQAEAVGFSLDERVPALAAQL